MHANDSETSRQPDDALDSVLRTELRWHAPPDLTTCLLEIAHQAAGTAPARVQVTRPPRWYSVLVTVLTIVAVFMSGIVAWQFYGQLSAELGIPSLWLWAQQTGAVFTAWLYEVLPASRYAVDLLLGLNEQLYWLLVAIVLWLVLDRAPATRLRLSHSPS